MGQPRTSRSRAEGARPDGSRTDALAPLQCPPAPLRVAVRTLCEFAAREGSLEHRYTPSPTAAEGSEAHRRLQRSRGEGYQAELLLQGHCQGLHLRGRADGYMAQGSDGPWLEEIKSHRGDPARIGEGARALHWAQLRVYGALLCRREGLQALTLRLTYLDIAADGETRLEEQASAGELIAHMEQLCRRYRTWADREQVHRQRRDQALVGLAFPFADFRRGQRPLSEAVYKAAATGRTLLLQAPTGIGKTLGVLYPLLMAMPRQELDRLFFLTARNTGRRLALDALKQLAVSQPEPLPLRVLELTARDQACEHPGSACHGDACPLARGFFDRLADARRDAANVCWLDREALAEIARRHAICPYYLGQEMARWSDLVVADVNHFFDQQALLFALTRQNEWKVVPLIDEAHNLIDRARGMYSATLFQGRTLALKNQVPPPLRKPLQGLARHWRQLVSTELAPQDGSAEPPAYRHLDKVPLRQPLQGLVKALTDHLTEQPGDGELQEQLFDAAGFLKLADSFADHSLCSLERGPRAGRATLAIRNLIPADHLRARFDACHAAVLFSATLSPGDYYRDLLGLPEDTVWQETESPFHAGQIQCRLITRISTRWRRRQASVGPIAERIAAQYRQRPGNYLVYLSSFDYLTQLHDHFVAAHPDIPTLRQEAAMADTARQALIDGFRAGRGRVGFAVLGGAFGEGIDLPGEALVGVFVATLGLPPHDAYHQELARRLEQRFGQGYRYAYLYPGLRKVVQAAGRLIRTPEDTGVIELIDDRLGQPDIQAQLPPWWFSQNA